MPQDFKKLDIWKESFELSIQIYREIIPNIPEWEKYGIKSQLSRAVTSISANIAEGSGRRTSKDFAYFLGNALGSAKETENFLMLANKIGYIKDDKFVELNNKLDLIGKKLMRFIQSVENPEKKD